MVGSKRNTSCRTIALPNVAVTALKPHRAHQPEERLAAGPPWREQGFVVTTQLGTPPEASNLTREFRKLRDTAGLP